MELINHLIAELNPICHLLALLGAHHIFHVSGLRVKYTLKRGGGGDALKSLILSPEIKIVKFVK